ncbi:uncharacterized protein VTP21DRAFT_204 [Calcarisporiella thermophila]|uniref:uncharacterized protein n=1 Tax=Calcarisporiella thermophila TaxID=911321 RepID=UPI003743B999
MENDDHSIMEQRPGSVSPMNSFTTAASHEEGMAEVRRSTFGITSSESTAAGTSPSPVVQHRPTSFAESSHPARDSTQSAVVQASDGIMSPEQKKKSLKRHSADHPRPAHGSTSQRKLSITSTLSDIRHSFTPLQHALIASRRGAARIQTPDANSQQPSVTQSTASPQRPISRASSDGLREGPATPIDPNAVRQIMDLAAISPDGKTVATLSRVDGMVMLWQYQTASSKLEPRLVQRTCLTNELLAQKSLDQFAQSQVDVFLSVSNQGQYVAISTAFLVDTKMHQMYQQRHQLDSLAKSAHDSFAASTPSPRSPALIPALEDASFLVISAPSNEVVRAPSLPRCGIPEFLPGYRLAVCDGIELTIFCTMSWATLHTIRMDLLSTTIGAGHDGLEQLRLALSLLPSGYLGWLEPYGSIGLWDIRTGELERRFMLPVLPPSSYFPLPFQRTPEQMAAAQKRRSTYEASDEDQGVYGLTKQGMVHDVLLRAAISNDHRFLAIYSASASGSKARVEPRLTVFLLENGLPLASTVVSDGTVDCVAFLPSAPHHQRQRQYPPHQRPYKHHPLQQEKLVTLGRNNLGETITRIWDPHSCSLVHTYEHPLVQARHTLPQLRLSPQGEGWFLENTGTTLRAHSVSPNVTPPSAVRLLPGSTFTSRDGRVQLTSILQPNHRLYFSSSARVISPEPWLPFRADPNLCAYFLDTHRVLIVGIHSLQIWFFSPSVRLQYIWTTPQLPATESSQGLYQTIKQVWIDKENEDVGCHNVYVKLSSQENPHDIIVRLPTREETHSVRILQDGCAALRLIRHRWNMENNQRRVVVEASAIASRAEQEEIARAMPEDLKHILLAGITAYPTVFSVMPDGVFPMREWILADWDDVIAELLRQGPHYVPAFFRRQVANTGTGCEMECESALTLATHRRKSAILWTLLEHMMSQGRWHSGYLTTFVAALPLLVQVYPDYVDRVFAEHLSYYAPSIWEHPLELLPTTIVPGVYDRSHESRGRTFCINTRLQTLGVQSRRCEKERRKWNAATSAKNTGEEPTHPALLCMVPLPYFLDYSSHGMQGTDSDVASQPKQATNITVEHLEAGVNPPSNAARVFPEKSPPMRSTSLFVRLALAPLKRSRVIFRHPGAVEPILSYKWNQFARSRYWFAWTLRLIYLALFLIAVSLPVSPELTTVRWALMGCVLGLAALLLIQEVRRFIVLRGECYVLMLGNWLRWIGLIALPIAVAIWTLVDRADVSQVLVSVSVLLMWANLLAQLCIFRAVGIFFYHAEQVFRRILVFFLVLAVLVFAFAHAFYLLLRDFPLPNPSSSAQSNLLDVGEPIPSPSQISISSQQPEALSVSYIPVSLNGTVRFRLEDQSSDILGQIELSGYNEMPLMFTLPDFDFAKKTTSTRTLTATSTTTATATTTVTPTNLPDGLASSMVPNSPQLSDPSIPPFSQLGSSLKSVCLFLGGDFSTLSPYYQPDSPFSFPQTSSQQLFQTVYPHPFKHLLSATSSDLYTLRRTIEVLLIIYLLLAVLLAVHLLATLINDARTSQAGLERWLVHYAREIAELERFWLTRSERKRADWFPRRILYYEVDPKKIVKHGSLTDMTQGRGLQSFGKKRLKLSALYDGEDRI